MAWRRKIYAVEIQDAKEMNVYCLLEYLSLIHSPLCLCHRVSKLPEPSVALSTHLSITVMIGATNPPADNAATASDPTLYPRLLVFQALSLPRATPLSLGEASAIHGFVSTSPRGIRAREPAGSCPPSSSPAVPPLSAIVGRDFEALDLKGGWWRTSSQDARSDSAFPKIGAISAEARQGSFHLIQGSVIALCFIISLPQDWRLGGLVK